MLPGHSGDLRRDDLSGPLAPPLNSPRPSMEERVRREQVRYTFSRLYFAFISPPLLAVVVVLMLWGHVPNANLIGWAALVLLVAGWRYAIGRSFFAVEPSNIWSVERWKRIFFISTAASAAAWGITAIAIFPEDSLPLQVLLAFLAGGLAAGASVTYAAIWPIPAVFVTLAVLPLALRFAYEADAVHLSLALTGFIYYIFISINLVHNHNMVMQSLRLKFENAELVEFLTAAKRQAEEATRLKDQFVSLVSHDLKSPLLSIRGALDLFRKGVIRPGEKLNDLLGQVTGSADGLLRMIDQLLEHNSLKSGKIQPEKRFLSAAGVAGEQMLRLGLAAKNKGITLVNDLPQNLLIFVDSGLFGQALSNLLSNAVKFTPKGGSVRVFAPQPGKPVIAVRDTGVGITPERLDSLFKAENHTTSLGTAGEKGFGLGLAYANEIVRAHGGTLAAESNPGAGSTFTIGLPEHKAVIMVVDDLPLHRERIKGLLACLGAVEVIEKCNGREAWEKLQSVAPDLVIMDIEMPEMNGYAFMEKMRREEAFRPIPVIVLSGQSDLPGDSAARDKAILSGADEFLPKTASDSAVLDAIRKYISPLPS